MEVEKLNFQIIENKSKTIPILKETKIVGKKWVSYGEKNDFPDYLFDLYLRSSVLQSIIEGIIDYTVGAGVAHTIIPSTKVNTDGETLKDIMKKILVDYLVFGGFALNILRDSNDNVSEIYWVDIRNFRLSEDGTIGYYADNINAWGAKPIEIPIFNPKQKQKSSIFYFKGHISRGLYPIPRWSGAITAVETSTEISKYHLSSIINNFSPSALISFNNGVPDKETQMAIEKKINNKFVGSDNVNRFILSFSDSGENATTIQKLDSDSADQKFSTLKDSIFEEIFISFRATPELFGMKKDGSGFNKTEYLESFSLFNKTIIQPIQEDLVDCFDKIYGYENSIKFNKYTVYDDEIVTSDEETPNNSNKLWTKE